MSVWEHCRVALLMVCPPWPGTLVPSWHSTAGLAWGRTMLCSPWAPGSGASSSPPPASLRHIPRLPCQGCRAGCKGWGCALAGHRWQWDKR